VHQVETGIAATPLTSHASPRLSFLFREPTFVTLDCDSVDMTLGLLVIPFLVAREPDLAVAANPAGKRAIDVILRQESIGIDMGKPAAVRQDCRRMLALLQRMKRRNALRFPKCFVARIAAGVSSLPQNTVVRRMPCPLTCPWPDTMLPRRAPKAGIFTIRNNTIWIHSEG